MSSELWQANASPAPWALPASFSVGFPTSGDDVTQTPPTHPGGHWFGGMAHEIRAVIEGAGLVFDPTDTGQFLAAILILCSQVPPAPPPAGDPYFANVKLLMHFNGANGATATIDSSLVAHTPTFYALAALSTAQSKFGGSSLHLPYADDEPFSWVAVSDDNDWNLGAGEWTLEFWCYRPSDSFGINNVVVGTGRCVPFRVRFSATGFSVSGTSGAGLSTPDASDYSALHSYSMVLPNDSLPADQWVFFQLRRRHFDSSNDVFEVAINGVEYVPGAPDYFPVGTPMGRPAEPLYIGGFPGTSSAQFGFIEDLRLTVGVARAFGLPTAQFPDN